jgi:hypothetical protein
MIGRVHDQEAERGADGEHDGRNDRGEQTRTRVLIDRLRVVGEGQEGVGKRLGHDELARRRGSRRRGVSFPTALLHNLGLRDVNSS